MKLNEAETGKRYTVQEMELERSTKMRLQALGMTPGTTIRILNKKKAGAIIFNVRGTRLAVGRQIAAKVQIGGAE